MEERAILKSLEEQPSGDQKKLVEQKFVEFLDQAAQPRHESRNACIKLCYFVEQCKESSSSIIRNFVYSQSTSFLLFDFYIEWNEKNQNRSMRQVLDLVSSLIAKNPNKAISDSTKSAILQRNLSIIRHRGAQPLVKPAFKSLESLLTRRTISTEELIEAYRVDSSESANNNGLSENLALSDGVSELWDSFVEETFSWIILPDISPAAGKFLVTLFRELRNITNPTSTNGKYTTSWQKWIRGGLERHPDSLENVKNYLLSPLFKTDRQGSLSFLQDLNEQKSGSVITEYQLGANALLRLAAIETGKKMGLVEDSSTLHTPKTSKKNSGNIIVHESRIASLLVHSLDPVRSLAFSVLVSSSSTIRPLTPTALQTLRLNLRFLHSDTDAKFRNDLLSNTRHLVERLRGATAFLRRELRHLGQSAEIPQAKSRDHKPADCLEIISNMAMEHESFIEWYVNFLLDELIPTTSYQRHITSLKSILLLIESGLFAETNENTRSKPVVMDNNTVWPFSIHFFQPKAIRLLLDLLIDPFEDVRITATSVLKHAPSSTLLSIQQKSFDNSHMTNHPIRKAMQPQTIETYSGVKIQPPSKLTETVGRALANFIPVAKALARRTGRADYADGVAHAHELAFLHLSNIEGRLSLLNTLLDELEENVALAETDLGKAVLDAPLHAVFASLNYVWESVDLPQLIHPEKDDVWNEIQLRMYHVAHRIWNAVKQVLCNDSPEGHLPQELDDIDIINTKDLLSYSFRAIHEASNLLRTLAGKIKDVRMDGRSVVPRDVFVGVANLTFEQLSTLRHRGAFSTVSLTFARICQLVQHLAPSIPGAGPSLLEYYYQDALKCIYGQESTTRRSAGIPALIAGILSANAKAPAFNDVMSELKVLARVPARISEIDETKLPQVHALNSLREIFKSSILGKRAESHIAEGLQIAADSLSSEVWAIRNCGLLLLRSLIDCLFGTSESKVSMETGWDGRSVKLSYDKYPALPELLLKLLDADMSNHADSNQPTIGAVESVFPALDIIRRAGPPDAERGEIYIQVCNHLTNRMWHIRELAARTAATLLIHDGWLAAIENLFHSCKESSTNKVHAVLMTVRFFVESKRWRDATSLIDDLSNLVDVLPKSERSLVIEYSSSQIKAARIELENSISQLILSTPGPRRTKSNYQPYADSFDDLEESLQTNPLNTLLHKSLVKQAVLQAALAQSVIRLGKIITLIASNTDLILTALEHLSESWNSHPDTISILGDIYLQVIELSPSAEVRAIAVVQLAGLLDQHFDANVNSHQEIVHRIESLPTILQSSSTSPSLANAQITISGWILFRRLSPASEDAPSRLKAWGELLSSAGSANEDFDTRCAAASALRSFFSHSGLGLSSISQAAEHLLFPLLALYDTLNDDDDEIRDIGAETISSMLKKSLIPLAAQEAFSEWLLERFTDSAEFSSITILRMTGSDTAQQQLASSLKVDNSLFVEEEQNLFIDEVRDARIWSKIFCRLSKTTLTAVVGTDLFVEQSLLSPLTQWTLDGLVALNSVTEKDGLLGWTSKPAAFLICTKILSCATAIVSFHQSHNIPSQEEVNKIKEQLRKVLQIEQFHPTLLDLASSSLIPPSTQTSGWISLSQQNS